MASDANKTRRTKTEEYDEVEAEMEKADRANGERPPDDATTDTEARWGKGESPA